MNEDFREIVGRLHESQSKHNDFLLAVAGACIALSIQRTTGATPQWSMVILALAVLSWGGSIWAGIKNRLHHQSNLYANAELLKVAAGLHPQAGTHPPVIAAASAGIMEAMEANSRTASWYAKCQIKLLFLGAVLFVAWHVLQMFLMTPAKMP